MAGNQASEEVSQIKSEKKSLIVNAFVEMCMYLVGILREAAFR